MSKPSTGPGFCWQARRRKKARRHVRPRNSLKQGPALRLPNKPLFYYKRYASQYVVAFSVCEL